MKIVHFAPFVPCACGLYEAARDMVVADILQGHDSQLVDVGMTINGEHQQGVVGKVDDRAGSKIVSASPDVVWQADVIVAHTGVPDNWIAPCQAPIVWVMHGRPRACFSPEYGGKGHSYTLLANLAKWPRVKKMVTFWPHHVQYWDVVVPTEKLVCLPAPPIDEKRFCKAGPSHDYTAMGSKWNVVIAESWREDIDTFEIVHGAIALAKTMNNVKFHFYAMELDLKCYEYIFSVLRDLGALGEVWARRANIEEVYRSADIVLSPQRIATRSVGEALSCEVPVIAANGCEYATYTMKPDDPQDVCRILTQAVMELSFDKESVINRVKEANSNFQLAKIGKQMTDIYQGLI
jgi:glycosyltransferase involved in cell wall biosynthesis